MAFFRVVQKENITMIICRTTPLERIDGMRVDILERNVMPGLFRIKREGESKFVYTSPRAFPLKDFLLLNLTEENFYRIAIQLVRVEKTVGEKGLATTNLFFDLEHVYIVPMTREIFCLYKPTINTGKEKRALEFLTEILHYYNKKHSKERPICSDIEPQLKAGNFSEINLENHIRIKCPQVLEGLSNPQPERTGYTAPGRTGAPMNMGEVRRQPAMSFVQEEPMLSGTTLLVDEDDRNEATMLLCESVPEEPKYIAIRLYRVRTNESYVVSQKEFSIGKEEGNHLVIRDNKTISRKHAIIKATGNGYSIMDMNSLNHTYLNGKVLAAGQEEIISDGDTIRLSDEEFKVEG